MSQNASIPTWAKVTGGIVLVVVLLGVWMHLASKLFFVWMFKGEPPFQPNLFTIVQYMAKFSQNKRVMTPAIGSIIGTGALVIGFPAFLLWPRKRSLHGDGRFAKDSEIAKMGLKGDDGIVIGKHKGKYLVSPGQHHVMLAAPTGAGKGVGVVIPNLLSWNHSAIVLDVKKENFRLTAGFRRKFGHKVFLFDPGATDRRTHRWNPLGYVREEHALRVDDLQKIAQKLYADVDGQDPIWSGGCRSLFLGLTLYLFETQGKTRSLGQVARESFGIDIEAMKTMIADRQAAGNPLSVECELALMDYINTPDKTRDSIRKTFTSRLELFLNPTIDAATCANDFDLGALRSERMTIYLGVTPDNLGRLAPILNLFFQQVLDIHTRTLPEHDPNLKYQLLLLMDEFVAMGKMQTLVDSIAFIRGYNIRLLPIFQSPSQVEAIYGRASALGFFQNHTCRIMYEPADFETAESISKQLGTETVKRFSKSTPLFGGKGGGSKSESEHGRAVMLPQELTTIGSDAEIIFIRGQMPVKADKIRFYEDPLFIQRLKAVAPSLAALGNKMPTKAQLDQAQFSNELSFEIDQVSTATVERPKRPDDKRPMKEVELSDLDRLDSIPLSDFSTDFSGITIPTGEMSEDEMAEFADTVYQQMLNN